MTDEARLGCVIPAKGGKIFAQVVTNEPLVHCRVLGSAFGATEDEAISAAMEKAGVAHLAAATPTVGHPAPGKGEAGLLVALVRCGMAVDYLIGAIRGH